MSATPQLVLRQPGSSRASGRSRIGEASDLAPDKSRATRTRIEWRGASCEFPTIHSELAAAHFHGSRVFVK